MGRFSHFVWYAYGILRCVGMRPSGQAAHVVEGVAGSPATLPCPGVQSDQDVTWFKIDSFTRVLILVRLRSGVAFVPANAADVWRDQISMENSDLLIHSLRTDRDSGKFVCLDVSKSQERSFNVTIWDRVTGATIGGYQGDKVTVSAGKSITLSCSVSGNPKPPPRYTWTIGDKTLVGGAGTRVYRLTAVWTMNGKAIACTAANYYSNGTILSTDYDNATLNVTFVGPVSITPPSITVIAGDSETVALTCSADGNPPVRFKWKKEGTFLKTSSVYFIPNALKSDAGDYECQASNGMTEKSANVTVRVYGSAPRDGSVVGPIVGAAAGVLVFVVAIISVFLWYRRPKHTGSKSDGEREITTQTGGQTGFDDPRWREPDAEIVVNDLYGSTSSHTRNVLPPKPENPVNTPGGKKVKDPYELHGGQEVASQSNNANEKIHPIHAQLDLSKKKEWTKVNEDVVLNYSQVEIPKQKKKKKKVIHRRYPTTNYADINFNAGVP